MDISGWRDNNSKFVKSAIYIRWQVTDICNFNCNYCSQNHVGNKNIHDISIIDGIQQNREFIGRNSSHSFDNFPVKTWIEAFKVFSGKTLSITLTGGEAFIDSNNINNLLVSLTHMNNVACIRIDTNGCWNPNKFSEVNWEKVYLNLSYHPTMISLKAFKTILKDKLDNGINIGMVNYVLAPNQLDSFKILRDEFLEMGVFLNGNIYFGPEKQTELGFELYKQFVPELDVAIKTNQLITKNLECYYPVIAYEISPSGYINVGCFPELRGDFICGKLPINFEHITSCPHQHCGCLDKYAFLKITNRCYNLNLLQEYADLCCDVAGLEEKL